MSRPQSTQINLTRQTGSTQLSSTRPAANTKGSRATAWETGKANSTTKMEGITRDTGKTTKWMAMGSCTTKAGSWPIKATGLRTSSMELAKYTMTILSPLLAHSITPTSTTLRTTGSIMGGCFQKTARRVGEGSSYQMGRCLREIFIRIRSREWGNFTLWRARLLRACGGIPN